MILVQYPKIYSTQTVLWDDNSINWDYSSEILGYW
jgi:hypothetical protein